MTFRNIDRQRYDYLLKHGTEPSEIRQFFKDCQRQLILHRAKVQNLPRNYEAAIHMLTVDMPESTDEVVQDWFSKHIKYENIEDHEIIIAVYKRFEKTNLILSDEASRRFARSCLIHLFSSDPSASLIEFLKTSLADKPVVISHTSCNHVIGPLNNLSLENFAKLLIDIIESNDADINLEFFPADMASFITAIKAVINDQIHEAKLALEKIPQGSVIRNNLQLYIERKEERSVICQKTNDDQFFTGAFDSYTDEVFGYCTRADKPTTVFVRPIAVVKSGQIQFLADERRYHLFPKNGDLIAFTGYGYPPQPIMGEFGIWKVAEHSTDKPTHFHLAADNKRTVYEVYKVPFCSTDYDSVRESIKNISIQSANSIQPLLFHLSDGLFVGAKSDKKLDFSRDETFERHLFLWDSLPTIRFEGRTFVAGPLPAEHRRYECASLTSTIRTLFKNRTEEENSPDKLSRAQLNSLVRYLNSFDAEVDVHRVQRIKAQLDMLLIRDDAFETFLQELMHHPHIKQRVDVLVEQKAERQLAEKANLQADIERLQKERGEWRERVRKQSEEYRKLPDNISKAVKMAFEKARTEGLSTIAELAVYKSFIEPPSSAGANNSPYLGELNARLQPPIRDLMPDNREVVSILKEFGVTPRKAKAFFLLGDAARRAGLIICIRGIAARPVAESWAKALSKQGILIDATIGLIDDTAVTIALTRSPKPDVLAILDANLSALDLYARPLLDIVLKRLVEPSLERRPAIFIALSDGVGALPLPRVFAQISVVIDLEANCSFNDESDLDELKSEVMNPEDGHLYHGIWRPAANRLREAIEELNEDEQKLVFSVLNNKS